LACVKHAASVQSEPGSNSSVQSLETLGIEVNFTSIRERLSQSPKASHHKACRLQTPTLIGCQLLKSIRRQLRRQSLAFCNSRRRHQ
ncbi:hypothetical protein, partial [Bacillus cereus group sp. Bce027]|uniref:hypothetical protein n=1 Tax=Bacillus cereus group sp. Bce027 TaxID=3445241 RepID=UPI003F69E253